MQPNCNGFLLDLCLLRFQVSLKCILSIWMIQWKSQRQIWHFCLLVIKAAPRNIFSHWGLCWSVWSPDYELDDKDTWWRTEKDRQVFKFVQIWIKEEIKFQKRTEVSWICSIVACLRLVVCVRPGIKTDNNRKSFQTFFVISQCRKVKLFRNLLSKEGFPLTPNYMLWFMFLMAVFLPFIVDLWPCAF